MVAGSLLLWLWYNSLARARRSTVAGELCGKHLQRLPTSSSPLPANGSIIVLSHGETFVQVDGVANIGPWVVLVHGNTGSSWYFQKLALELAGRGRRVLRYDLYGRGWSACNGFPHTRHLFTGQLAEVLFAHGITEPFDLVGYSIGGQIALLFASLYASRLRTLVVISPAVETPPGWALNLLQSSIVGSFVGRLAKKSLASEKGYSRDWVDLEHPDAAVRERSQALLAPQYAGEKDRFEHEPALWRTFCLSIGGLPWMTDVQYLKQLQTLQGQCGVPIYCLWGVKDNVTRVKGAYELQRHLPCIQMTKLPERGHSLPYEHFEECATLLVERFGKAYVNGPDFVPKTCVRRAVGR